MLVLIVTWISYKVTKLSESNLELVSRVYRDIWFLLAKAWILTWCIRWHQVSSISKRAFLESYFSIAHKLIQSSSNTVTCTKLNRGISKILSTPQKLSCECSKPFEPASLGKCASGAWGNKVQWPPHMLHHVTVISSRALMWR